MSLNIANGQLAATTPASLAAVGVPSTSDLWTLVLRNTSSSLTEVITTTVTRTAGGTARKYPQITLLPNESAVLENVPMESGDVMKAATTDATTVDFTLTSCGGPPPPNYTPTVLSVYDSSGNKKSSSSAALALAGVTQFSSAPSVAFGATMALVVASNLITVAANHTTSATATINCAATAPAGALLTLVITEGAGTGTVVTTFGTHFKSTGTLTTASSGISAIAFMGDGTNWNEIGRGTTLS